jgi:hypothetical protein
LETRAPELSLSALRRLAMGEIGPVECLRETEAENGFLELSIRLASPINLKHPTETTDSL